MANSMIDTITQCITPSLASSIGSTYGDSQSAVTRGFAATIPTVLGLVTSRAHDPGFMNQVYALANDPANDPGLFDDSTRIADRLSALHGGAGPFERFRALLFGPNSTNVVDAISRHAGVKSSTASSILAASIPLVLAYVGRMIRLDGLDAGELGRRLSTENRAVMSAIPPTFSGILSAAAGLAGTAAGVRSAARDAIVRRPQAPAYAHERRSAWPWVAGALALAAILGTFSMYNRHRPADTARTVGTAGHAADTTAPLVTRALPNGVALRFPAAGSESQLLGYVMSGVPVSGDAWVDFDRINFETDSARLRPSSRDQLSGIANILKAYPAVHLKIGGYTDNAGDPAANLRLSQERAMSVMNELVSMGVPRDRLEAEGYGQEHPVASNSTDQGRAQNRRVAFRVTAK